MNEESNVVNLDDFRKKIRVTTYTHYPACEEDCLLSKECANHRSTGDFRLEDGMTPLMKMLDDGSFTCERKRTGSKGALIIENGKLRIIEWYPY